MSAIDIELTFPCYMPLYPDNVPITALSVAGEALLVFTDADLLRRYFAGNPQGPVVKRMAFDHSEALCQVLKGVRHQGQNVFVLIDATFGPRRQQKWCYPLRDFVSHLETAA